MAEQIKQSEYIIKLPKKKDSRGNLSFLEEGGQVPFKIARVYWIYDVPGGQKRGSHAFKNQQEIIIALSGSFDVVLKDGTKTRRHTLNRSYKALYVPPKMWRTLENFATNSVCLVISSGKYDENEYIRNFRQFKQFLKISHTDIDCNQSAQTEGIIQKQPRHSRAADCRLTDLPVTKNRAGNLTPVHNSVEIPFSVKRIFFVYDIPYGKTRGMHAHKTCHEFIIAASGSFDVELDDGKNKRIVSMNRPTQGVHILPGIWTKESNYSSGATCLVLASEIYSENDYIRKYADFKEYYADRNKEI